VQPNRIWDLGSVVAFYNPGNLFQFSLRQVQTDLLLQVATKDGHRPPIAESLRVKGVFRRLPPSFIRSAASFITITSGTRGVSIYIDGALVTVETQFLLSATDFNGAFVLGDSPGQPNGWRGQLFGFAIYGRQLEETQVYHNYTTWKQNGRPELAESEHNKALYLFDERKGNTVHDKAHSGVDLYIPEKYEVEDKIALEPFWTEFSMSRSYWGAVLKNIVGFIPFGICFSAYLSVVHPIKRVVFLTVALGLGVSLTIEILQAFLPNRDSGTSDLITNTLGAWIGAASYRLVIPAMAQVFPRLSAFTPKKWPL
jgi:glycopeptide antibiotics resistance protein